MPSNFSSFGAGDVIEANHVSEMHSVIQNLERGAAFYGGTSSGSSTAYTVTMTPAPDDPYQAGMLVNFKIHTDNEAGSPDVTLNVNGVGAKPILKNDGQSLAAGDLKAGQVVSVILDPAGSQAFKLVSGGGSGNSSISWAELPFDQAIQNTLLGNNVLASNEGSNNTAVGFEALRDNTSGANNTATGAIALGSNTTGVQNTALGSLSLMSNTSGLGNTAVGYQALAANTSGAANIAIGQFALQGNTEGDANIAIGWEALFTNAGGQNTVVGSLAMGINTSGSYNCAMGYLAMRYSQEGDFNAALGHGALYFNTDGSQNSALGAAALGGNTQGTGNVAVGYSCGNGITTGSNNIVLGSEVNVPDGTASDQINIGNAFLRAAVTKAVSLRAGAVAYANSADEVVLDVTGRRGWLMFSDDSDGWCRLRVKPSGITLEASSSDWVASSTPASGEVGLYLSGSDLHMVLGSAAGRSIGFTDNLVQF